jgi:hypothetical protein
MAEQHEQGAVHRPAYGVRDRRRTDAAVGLRRSCKRTGLASKKPSANPRGVGEGEADDKIEAYKYQSIAV